jgi:thiopurine S-methyltransferase
MQLEFWEQRWEQNQLAFHSPDVNSYLIKYLAEFNLPVNAQVFVPLCGKSLDLAWLALQNYSVLGIECSEKAVSDFFAERKLNVNISQNELFKAYQYEKITLLQGDFFKLNKTDLADVRLVYDRASLIALPEAMREDYISLLKNILPEQAEILLITLEYNQSIMSGPPFSVSHNELVKLYQAEFSVQLLFEADVLDQHERFRQRGLNYLTERVYKIVRCA